jgi:phage shock protein C
MDPQMNPRRLYRSADDRIFAGVAGGMAAYFDIDPVIVRIIWFLSIFFTGSLTFWVYLIMIAVVPPEPTDWPSQSGWTPSQRPFGYEASYAPPSSYGPPAAGAAPAGGPTAADASGSVPPGAPGAPGADPNAAPGMPSPAPGGWWSNDWRWQRRQERWQRRAERWQQKAERHEYRDYGGPGLVFGLLLILGGGMLAWHQFDPNFDLGLTWPVLVIAVGAILVISSIRRADR